MAEGTNKDNDFWNAMSVLMGEHKSNSRYYSKSRERDLYERDLAALLKKAQKEDSAVYKFLVRRYIREMKPVREFDIRKIKKYAAKNTVPGMLIKCRTKDGRVRYYLNTGFDKNGKPILKRLNKKQMKLFLSRKMRRELEKEYARRCREQTRRITHSKKKTIKTTWVMLQEKENPKGRNWFENEFMDKVKNTSMSNKDLVETMFKSGDAESKRFIREMIKGEKINTIKDFDNCPYLTNLRQKATKEKTIELITKEKKEMEFRKKIQIGSPRLSK